MAASVGFWVEQSFQVRKVDGLIYGLVKSKTENLTPVASLMNVHHLRARGELVCVESV